MKRVLILGNLDQSWGIDIQKKLVLKCFYLATLVFADKFDMHIKVKVFPGAKREYLRKKDRESFEISVREKAERNLANKRVIEIIAEHFGVSPKKVQIISGHRSRNKLLSVSAG